MKSINVICEGCASLHVDKLTNLQGNLKTLDEENYNKLRDLIVDEGFAYVVSVARCDGKVLGILDGHQRVYTIKRMMDEGYNLSNKKLPVNYVDVDDIDHAYRLILAAVSQFGKVTDDGLTEFMKQADMTLEELANYDLPDFDFESFAENIEQAPENQDKNEQIEIQNVFSIEQQKQEIIKVLKPFTKEDLFNCIVNPASIMREFNLLCSGSNSPAVGYYISLHFNPHRLDIDTKGSFYSITTKEKWKKFSESLARYFSQYGESILAFRWLKTAALGIGGVKIPNEFRPQLARNIYQDYLYKTENAKVLDPCHGWGGRVIGWLATQMKGSYTGYDPSTKTNSGVKEIIEFLKQSTVPGKANVHCKPFEDVKLKANTYDFAMTSPPYYDTEQYATEETQSFIRYNSLEKWHKHFLEPLIVNTIKALKSNKCFLLNIGNATYNLADRSIIVCRKYGYEYKRIEKYTIGGFGVGERTNQDGIKGETFLEITKP